MNGLKASTRGSTTLLMSTSGVAFWAGSFLCLPLPAFAKIDLADETGSSRLAGFATILPLRCAGTELNIRRLASLMPELPAEIGFAAAIGALFGFFIIVPLAIIVTTNC